MIIVNWIRVTGLPITSIIEMSMSRLKECMFNEFNSKLLIKCYYTLLNLIFFYVIHRHLTLYAQKVLQKNYQIQGL